MRSRHIIQSFCVQIEDLISFLNFCLLNLFAKMLLYGIKLNYLPDYMLSPLADAGFFVTGRKDSQQLDGEGDALAVDGLSSRGRPSAERAPHRCQTHPGDRAEDQVRSTHGKTLRRKYSAGKSPFS